MQFSDLNLTPLIQKAVTELGYSKPTPIQTQAIPIILEGRDLLGIAQTGTGKTAAFCLPILNRIYIKQEKRSFKSPKVLILTPTRELAIQIHSSLVGYGKHLNLNFGVIFGGVGQGNQVRSISQGLDILVATPGRLLDLISQKYLQLDKVNTFVLDEADRMLDMGFMRDIKKILPLLPSQRHNLFFSATMPQEIQKLAESILKSPRKVEVTPPSTTVEKIKQKVMFVEKKEKGNLLVSLIKSRQFYKVLVFVEMKHLANKVADKLIANGLTADSIHGNKSQNARQRAIENFNNDKIQVLVATDIASRGIDIDGITHVINYDLPNLSENYVHRIGRTARAGASGESISFCTSEEKSYLVNIEKDTRQKIAVDYDHPYHSDESENAKTMRPGRAKALIESQNRSEHRAQKNFRKKRTWGNSRRNDRGGKQSRFR